MNPQMIFITPIFVSQALNAEGVVTNRAAIAAWHVKDVLARGYLIATIESQQQRSLINCTTANQMWVRLSAQYLRNAVENRHVLQARFFEYRYKPDHDIMSHVTEVETMATELADVGAPVDSISIMTKIICTLPPSYRSFITAWDSVPFGERTMALLTSRLLKEEAMAKRWSTGQPDSQDAAYFAHHYPTYGNTPNDKPSSAARGRDRGERRGSHPKNRRPYRFCNYHRCKIPGHTIEVCRRRLRDEENAAKEKSLIAKSDLATKGKEQLEDAYLSSTCFASRSIHDWFADSGCTQHMTEQRHIFSTFTPVLSNTWTVKGIGTSLLVVRGYGNIEFVVRLNGSQQKITLEKVLYVPGLGTNLLSIAAVTDVGLSVHFVETQVTLTRNQTIVMVGERVGRLLGYSLSQKAYRFWDVIGRKIKISRDVIFDEFFNAKPDFSTNLEREDFLEILPKFSNPIQAPQPSDQANPINLMPPVAEEILETQQEPSRSPDVASPGIIDTSEDTSNSTTPPENNDSASSPPRTRFSPYPLRNRQPRKQWQSLLSFDSQEDEIYEPTSYADAMKSPDAELWKAAIQDEMKSLMTNKTWSLSELPPGRKCTLSRWVLKVKPATPGSPARYKARLVAKGFSQRPGIDFEETFSPVIKHDTLRVVLSFVAAYDMEMSQLDVKTAFLYGELDEEIYLQQPEGYVVAGKEKYVCRLHKCIYGLKQASRVWNRHFDHFLKKFGLRPSSADPCLYIRQNQGELVIVIIWVDDCLICSNNGSSILDIVKHLNEHFDMRCTVANHFVGLSIHRDRQTKTLFLSQPIYIKKILQRFNMANCRPRNLPAEPGHHLHRSAEKGRQEETMPYREAVGSLMYLMVATRPDISFSVGQVSQFCEDPEPSHWEAVKRILSYCNVLTCIVLTTALERERYKCSYMVI
jgi:hypothetical protein